MDKAVIGNPAPQFLWQSRLSQGVFPLQCSSAVAENQPTNKNRMTSELSNFAARLRESILSEGRVPRGRDSELPPPPLATARQAKVPTVSKRSEDGRTPNFELQSLNGDSQSSSHRNEAAFSKLALELFALQFKHNAAYRKICESRGLKPNVVKHWTQIPVVPTAAFKELELTCLPPNERTAVFHSSGTTEQRPSRHHHSAESLNIYEASLWQWFEQNVFAGGRDARPRASVNFGRAG